MGIHSTSEKRVRTEWWNLLGARWVETRGARQDPSLCSNLGLSQSSVEDTSNKVGGHGRGSGGLVMEVGTGGRFGIPRTCPLHSPAVCFCSSPTYCPGRGPLSLQSISDHSFHPQQHPPLWSFSVWAGFQPQWPEQRRGDSSFPLLWRIEVGVGPPLCFCLKRSSFVPCGLPIWQLGRWLEDLDWPLGLDSLGVLPQP